MFACYTQQEMYAKEYYDATRKEMDEAKEKIHTKENLNKHFYFWKR